MPREFANPAARNNANKREVNRRQVERSEDRMIRRATNRSLRQCAEYEADHWPAPALKRVAD